jgi:hypothetical protein
MLNLLKRLFSIKTAEKETTTAYNPHWPFPKDAPATVSIPVAGLMLPVADATVPVVAEKKPRAKKPAAKKPAAKKPVTQARSVKPKSKKQTS